MVKKIAAGMGIVLIAGASFNSRSVAIEGVNLQYRLKIESSTGAVRYQDIGGMDDIDIAVAIVQTLNEGDTYQKARYQRVGTGSVRLGDDLILRTSAGSVEYDSYRQVKQAIKELDENECYAVISQENPIGSKASVLLESRPCFE